MISMPSQMLSHLMQSTLQSYKCSFVIESHAVGKRLPASPFQVVAAAASVIECFCIAVAAAVKCCLTAAGGLVFAHAVLRSIPLS